MKVILISILLRFNELILLSLLFKKLLNINEICTMILKYVY